MNRIIIPLQKTNGGKRFCNDVNQNLIKHLTCILLFLLFAGLVIFNQTVKAQDSVNAGVSGSIFNFDNTPLPDIPVVFTNLDTGVPVSTLTDKNGQFVKYALPPGQYKVEITVKGNKIKIAEQLLVATRTNAVLPPFKLPPDDSVTTQPTANPSGVITPTPISTPVVTTVQTTPANTSLQTDTDKGLLLETRRGGAFTNREVTNLPLGGSTLVRSFDELALLVPGVAPPPQAIGNSVGPGVGPGVGTSGQFSVNGLRSRANNFTVDGSDNNDEDIGVRRQGFFSLIPQPIESVQEFQIITLLAPAQFGRNLGAQVNALSKSGGNDFHGTLYGFFNSDHLNARNYFDFVGENTRLPLQGRRLNGTFANVATQTSNLATPEQVFVENTAGDEDSLTFLQGGGVLSGPIVREKMFFFISAEGQLLNASKESHFAVPTVEQRGFLGTGAEGISIPSANIAAFPTSVSGDFIFSLFPFSNDPSGVYGRNTYTQVLPANARGRVVSGKYDHNFGIGGRQQFLTARYNYTDDKRYLQQVGGALFSGVRPLTRTDNISAFLSGELTDKLSNVLRVSYGRTRLEFEEIPDSTGFLLPIQRKFDNPNDARFLLNARSLINFAFPGREQVVYRRSGVTLEDLFGPIGQVIVSGFSPIGVDVFNFPQKRINNTYQFADTLFLRTKGHNFAFGTDIRRTFLNSDLPRNSRPLVTFTGAFRASNFTAPAGASPGLFFSPTDLVAAGAPTGVFQSLVLPEKDANIELSYNQFNFFIQDDYNRINPNLTISYGLRYELNTVPKEADGKIENSFSAVLPAAVSGLNQFINGRSQIYDLDSNNLAPRIGFAYSPNQSTVIRGGYGVYYDQVLGAVVSQSRNVFPTFTTVNFGATTQGQSSMPSSIFTCIRQDGRLSCFNQPGESSLPPPLSIFNPLGPSRNIIRPGTLNTLNITQEQLIALATQFPTPFGATIPERQLMAPLSHQYSIGFDRQLFSTTVFSAAYVGTSGRNLLRFTTPNLGRNNIININSINFDGFQPEFSGTNRPPVGRAVANIGPIDRFETTGRSQYNSLQLQLRGQLTPLIQGFQYQVAYTLAKAKDDVSDVFDLAGAPALPQNSNSFAGEYAAANFDVRHRVTYNFIYDLPELNNQNGFVKQILGGWQITGTGKFNTGQPFTVNTVIDVNQDGNLTDRLNNTQFIETTGSRRQPLALTTNTANIFSMLAPIGQDGAILRNSFRAGSVLELDLSFNKRFSITERQNLFLRLDAFNFINRANFGIPVRFLESPNFGQAVETVTPGRRFQIALKYNF